MNLKKNWKNLLYLVALAALAYALLKIFDAEKALPQLNYLVALAAIAAYLLSIVFWNVAWGNYLKTGWKESNLVGWSAQFGAMTPFSLGNDVLRGYFAKQHGKKFSEGAAASLATKFYKIALALAFSLLGAVYLIVRHREVESTLEWGVALPLLILAGVYIFTREKHAEWIAKLSFNKISKEKTAEFSAALKKYIHKPSFGVLGWLLASLALEFVSFYLGFLAFGVALPPFVAYLVFSLVFFISKVPVLPQGIVVTEFVGLVLLQNTAALPLVAAGILLWNVSRIWMPIVVSGSVLLASGKKLTGLFRG